MKFWWASVITGSAQEVKVFSISVDIFQIAVAVTIQLGTTRYDVGRQVKMIVEHADQNIILVQFMVI